MNSVATDYDSTFYDMLDQTSLDSASIVVPIVVELTAAKSVVDVGCGRGAWLAQFLECGVDRVQGLDSQCVDRNALLFDRNSFKVTDLSTAFSIDESFDLAVCLEVAEHLPHSRSRHLVQELTKASSVVMFSAAIPGQGGTHHVNEQWNCFWHQRFAEREFDCFDVLRPKIVSERQVAWWFRQNTFLYAARGTRVAHALANAKAHCDGSLIPIAPHVIAQFTSVGGLFGALSSAIWRTIRNRLVR